MARVTPSKGQRLRLRLLHWDKLARAREGTVWAHMQVGGQAWSAGQPKDMTLDMYY
jgi:hypothetical protein